MSPGSLGLHRGHTKQDKSVPVQLTVWWPLAVSRRPGRGRLGCCRLRGGWWWEGWKKKPRVQTTLSRSSTVKCRRYRTVSEGKLWVSSGGGGRETLDQGWIIILFCLKKKKKRAGTNVSFYIVGGGVRGRTHGKVKERKKSLLIAGRMGN